MQAVSGARWRSWLFLIVSGLGALVALGFSALLLFSALLMLFGNTGSEQQGLSLMNLAWASALVAFLCVPGLFLSIRELSGKPVQARPTRRNFAFASLALLAWIGLVFLFEPLETSRLAWLFLPPLILLATIVPLWWYLEAGQRGLKAGSRARAWGLVSFSLVVSQPLILILEIFALFAVIIAFATYISARPELAAELQRYLLVFQNFSDNPEVIQDTAAELFKIPGVIAVTLAATAGLIPVIEELFKPLAVWLLAGDQLKPSQGFVAGMWCGACFALFENLTALSAAGDGSGTLILLARVGTGLLHVVTAGLTGWGLAMAWQDRKNIGRLILAYLLAVFLHAIWNLAGVMSGVAPLLPLRTELPALIAGFGETAPITLGILIGLNLVLLFFINFRLRKQEAAPPGAAGLIPMPPASDQSARAELPDEDIQ